MDERGRSRSQSQLRSHSRGRTFDDSRSLSRARRTAKGVEWTILNHDPSERLVASENKGEAEKDNDNANGDEKNNENDTAESEESEEEQISDTDHEFRYDDVGALLPNYATYKKDADSFLLTENEDDADDRSDNEQEPTTNLKNAGDILKSATEGLKQLVITQDEDAVNNRIVKEAREVSRHQALEAAQAALNNAIAVGAPIPRETIMVIKKLPKQELEYIDIQSLHANAKLVEAGGSSIDELPEAPKTLRKSPDSVLRKYATYKSKITSSETPSDFLAPYTYDNEVELDIRLAKELNKQITIGEIDSSMEDARCIRTITRGPFFQNLSVKKKPNSYLICMDFSAESLYALEWAIGSVLQNDSVVFIVYVIEGEKEANQAALEKARENGIEKLTKLYLDLIKLTKLTVHAVIEVIHHPIPRHLITEIIDYIQPSLVVVGSRGKNALQGVLLGSLSNYLVTKSSVPVMVVRKELKRTLKKKKFLNNFGAVHSLKDARVD